MIPKYPSSVKDVGLLLSPVQMMLLFIYGLFSIVLILTLIQKALDL